MKTISYGELRLIHIALHAACVEKKILPWYSVIPLESSLEVVAALGKKLAAKTAPQLPAAYPDDLTDRDFQFKGR
jgi:hypothetical protein